MSPMKKIKKEQINACIEEQGIIPPFHHTDAQTAVAVTEALYKGGLRIFEFTNRSEGALDVFKAIVAAQPKKYPEMILGAGTIMNVQQAKKFYKAGARFIVAPTLSKAVGSWCKKENVFWCPGVGTATEAVQAHEWGAGLVKLFPAEVLGPLFIKALKAPCPWLKVMPSGGVTLDKENLRHWFQSGATCVAIGSNLFDQSIMSRGDFDALSQRMKTILQHIREVR
jgi:2-dehydro-3-deoxyphosphogluconate aldolase/(4S)-4-hydroxy-2-oxoglutarate aldolase